EDGQAVRAGQLLGFVGDSGDAAGGEPHLHFEIVPNDDEPVSPYRWLRRAHRPLFAQRGELEDPAQPVTLRLQGKVASIRTGEPAVRLVLRARVVRTEDGRRFRPARSVTVAVPADAVVRRRHGSSRKPSSLRRVSPGDEVVLWTVPSDPSAAQIARPAALVAARLLLRR
ncbi:MAG: M23 family metallopeptidase, partial [Gaiellales bacterium]